MVIRKFGEDWGDTLPMGLFFFKIFKEQPCRQRILNDIKIFLLFPSILRLIF